MDAVLGESGGEAVGVTVVEAAVVAGRQLADPGPIEQPRHVVVHERQPPSAPAGVDGARRTVRHRPGRQRRYRARRPSGPGQGKGGDGDELERRAR